jgi:sugar fermentation stimulation protein A
MGTNYTLRLVMHYEKELVPAILLKRYKRFLADVRFENGDEITVHCANTGAMTGCAIAGSKIWLSKSDNLKRKYSYSWELVELEDGKGFICVNTARANKVIHAGLLAGKVTQFSQYKNIRPEVKYGEASRVDFLLSETGLEDVYLEVKSVTLQIDGELGAFPDAVTLRGQKHLLELLEMKRAGHRAVLVFCVLHSTIRKVTVADNIDPKYGKLLREVINQGVEVYCYSVDMSVEGLYLSHQIPLEV